LQFVVLRLDSIDRRVHFGHDRRLKEVVGQVLGFFLLPFSPPEIQVLASLCSDKPSSVVTYGYNTSQLYWLRALKHQATARATSEP
jgi:hypothetical protein